MWMRPGDSTPRRWGSNLPSDGTSETSVLEAWPLHEQARARGAPPHWLGHIAVASVDESVSRLVESREPAVRSDGVRA